MRKIVFDFNDIPKTDNEHEPQETSSKKIRTTQEDMYKYISNIMKSQETRVGLGIHAVRKEKVNGQPVSEILNKICENGLDIKKGSSVLATVSSLGISTDLKNHQKEAIQNYRLGSEMAESGVIVLVPTILEGNGEQLFVGFPGMDTTAVGNNHKTTCILDQLCCGNNDYGEVPKEFILGYFTEENGERKFQKNSNHFLEMTDEEKGIYIKSLSDRLTQQQKQISEAVIARDMTKLEQLSLEICGNPNGTIGDNTVIQNAMLYLSRDIGQFEQIHDDNNRSDSKKGKHRILLDTYRNEELKQGDLDNAYATISKTKDERERTYIKRRYTN